MNVFGQLGFTATKAGGVIIYRTARL